MPPKKDEITKDENRDLRTSLYPTKSTIFIPKLKKIEEKIDQLKDLRFKPDVRCKRTKESE